MEELAPRAKLEDDIVVLARFGEVDKLDNIGMV